MKTNCKWCHYSLFKDFGPKSYYKIIKAVSPFNVDDVICPLCANQFKLKGTDNASRVETNNLQYPA